MQKKPFYIRKQSVYTCLLLVFCLRPASDHRVQGQAATHQLWDIASLQEAPSFQWLEQNAPVRSFLYKSVDFENRPTEVFAYYSNPDMLLGRPKSGREYPALVLVHGGGGTAFKEWVEKWAAEGYAAVAMDLSGRDGEGKRLENAGPGQAHDDKFTKIENSSLKDVWTYHAVASILLAHSWLLSQPEVNPSKTGITGISWGGYLTTIAGSIDHRFKAAVPVYGCGFYDESDVFSEPLNQLSTEGKKKWMANFDPSVYLPGAKARFLFLNGNKDRFYNVVPYHKTYRLADAANRKILIIPDMKHSHYHGWEPHEIKYFFDQVLEDKAPLPDLKALERSSDKMTISYASPVSLYSAEFYYSNDITSPNETRKWYIQKAEIDPASKMITTNTPKEGFKYGFFYIRDNRNVSSSSEFIIND